MTFGCVREKDVRSRDATATMGAWSSFIFQSTITARFDRRAPMALRAYLRKSIAGSKIAATRGRLSCLIQRQSDKWQGSRGRRIFPFRYILLTIFLTFFWYFSHTSLILHISSTFSHTFSPFLYTLIHLSGAVERGEVWAT